MFCILHQWSRNSENALHSTWVQGVQLHPNNYHQRACIPILKNAFISGWNNILLHHLLGGIRECLKPPRKSCKIEYCLQHLFFAFWNLHPRYVIVMLLLLHCTLQKLQHYTHSYILHKSCIPDSSHASMTTASILKIELRMNTLTYKHSSRQLTWQFQQSWISINSQHIS